MKSILIVLVLVGLLLLALLPVQAQDGCTWQPDGSQLCCEEQPDGTLLCVSAMAETVTPTLIPTVAPTPTIVPTFVPLHRCQVLTCVYVPLVLS